MKNETKQEEENGYRERKRDVTRKPKKKEDEENG